MRSNIIIIALSGLLLTSSALAESRKPVEATTAAVASQDNISYRLVLKVDGRVEMSNGEGVKVKSGSDINYPGGKSYFVGSEYSLIRDKDVLKVDFSYSSFGGMKIDGMNVDVNIDKMDVKKEVKLADLKMGENSIYKDADGRKELFITKRTSIK